MKAAIEAEAEEKREAQKNVDGMKRTNSGFDNEAGESDQPSRCLFLPTSSTMSDTASVSTIRTAVPISPALDLPSASADPLSRLRPILILQPAKASGIESRYIAAMAAEMEEDEGRNVREAWEKCLKYFNGEHALERIAVREGWKRKRVEALRACWVKRGTLVEVRHW